MRIKINRKTKYSAVLLTILTLSSILALFPINFNSTAIASKNEEIDDVIDFNSPSLSTTSNKPWWNASFIYRQLINISNSHEAFTDFIANITFNYKDLVGDGHMNSSLKDVRIVENGILRNYYIELDFPKNDFATVWFETNVSVTPVGEPEQDTFMYYGNNNTEAATDYLMSSNPDGLIWYKFEEIVGGEVIDYMGNYNATVVGAQLRSGLDEQALGQSSLYFDGTNDYLAIQDKNYASANILSELTVLTWFRTSQSGGSNFDNWAFFDFDRSEYFNFYIRPNGGSLGFSTASPIDDYYGNQGGLNDDSWHFGCAKYDGNFKYLYLDDGVLDPVGPKVDTHSGGIGTGTTRYGIIGDGSEASSEDGSRNNIYYRGYLDEIRYFEDALSAERIEWIAKKYFLDTTLNEEQIKQATIKITVKDVDGRAVPGAEVFLFNTTNQVNYTLLTNEYGIADFLNINNSYYDITVNYTINNGTVDFEKIVFDGDGFDFTGLNYEVFIDVDLWTIDFEIEDWDYEPMGYGYALVYNKSDYTELLANLTLNKELGTQTFSWVNTSDIAKYFYEVYYENADYEQPHTLINKSSISRAVYLNKKLTPIPTINVNQTNIDLIPGEFEVQEKVYASGSNETHIGNTKIINTTIFLNKMAVHMDKVDIYYIDSYNDISTDPIFSKEYSVETSDTIKLDISELASAYGLLISIEGTNSSVNCNGTIDIIYTETCNHYIRVNMSKLIVNVYDATGTPDPMPNIYIHVINGTGGEDIVTLLTDEQGIAKGIDVPELDFWYITNTKYNFTLEYFDTTQIFNASSDQYTTPYGKFLTEYNYTLVKNSSIEFKILLDLNNYTTEIQETLWDTDLEWESDFFFKVRFVSTTNALDPSPTWTPITTPDYIKWEIKDKYGDVTLYSGNMIPEGDGYFNFTFDSTSLIGNEQYLFVVNGKKTGFQDPDPALMLFTVSPKATSLGVYNTTSMASLGDNVTQYYGELIDLTVLYASYGVYLTGATVTYDWQFIDTPITISEDPAGVYSFVIDTSIADVGIYQVIISASLDNHSAITNYRFDIHIITRPTSLNGDTSLHHISKTIWVKEAYNFTFEYKDILTEPHEKLGDLDIAYYQWYKLYPNGTIQGAISDTIDLIKAVNNTYDLDFDTESREIGSYAIFITLSKNNYEVRIALVDLTIITRTFDYLLNATNLAQSQIKIIQGQDARIDLQLTDESNNDAPLLGATVILKVDSIEYSLTDDDNDGVYTYTFKTDDINAFFGVQVIQGVIIVTKEDFVSQSISMSIVVGMPEIFPGFPMFYFLIIVVGVVAVVGSLVTYRQILRSKIPKFVKKVREMSKNIKGRKDISESLLYPSKEEYIVKILGDKWEMLGLSLKDILGIETRKVKKLPQKTEIEGGGT